MALAHITLATRDVESTRKFFQDALGWQPIARPGNIPMQSAWLAICPGQELHLVHVQDFAPSPFEREFGRHIAITRSQSDFDSLKSRLGQLGAEVIEPLRATPHRRFFFRDPNGYIFEVIESATE